MNKSISTLKDKSFYLPINLYRFNPCREWLILKIKFSGHFLGVSLIYNELLASGLTEKQLAGSLAIIYELHKKGKPKETIIRIVKRNVKAKDANK